MSFLDIGEVHIVVIWAISTYHSSKIHTPAFKLLTTDLIDLIDRQELLPWRLASESYQETSFYLFYAFLLPALPSKLCNRVKVRGAWEVSELTQL